MTVQDFFIQKKDFTLEELILLSPFFEDINEAREIIQRKVINSEDSEDSEISNPNLEKVLNKEQKFAII